MLWDMIYERDYFLAKRFILWVGFLMVISCFSAAAIDDDESATIIFSEDASKKEQAVSGVVTDANTGNTLPGVNILVKGTTTGTSTDSEGEYELIVPSLQDTLVVSYIGYETQEEIG